MSLSQKVFFLFSLFSPLAPLLVGWKMRGALWYYVLLSILCDSIHYLWLFPPYDYWYVNTFWATQFALVSTYLVQTIPELFRVRKAIYTGVALVLLLFCIHAVKGNFWQPDFHGGAVLDGLLLLPVLYGFYSIVQGPPIARIEHSPLFLVCVAFLLYCAGSFLVMLFVPRFKITDDPFVKMLWLSLHDGLNFGKNLLIARAFYLQSIAKSSASSDESP